MNYNFYAELASRPAVIGLRKPFKYDPTSVRFSSSNEKKSDMVPYYDITIDEEKK